MQLIHYILGKLLRSLSKIFTLSTLGKILGLVKIQLLTFYFGANAFTDALIIVLNIFWFWSNEIIYSLFSNTLIPKLAKLKDEDQRLIETFNIFKSANILSFTFFLLAIILNIYIVRLFAPSASNEFYSYSKWLIIYLSPIALLIPLTEIFTLYNQYKEKYFISTINMSVWNTFQIVAILISIYIFNKDINNLILFYSIFTIIGYLVTAHLQLNYSRYYHKFKVIDLISINLNGFFTQIKSNYKFLLSTILFQLNIYINLAFISKLDSGYITIYDIVVKIPNVFQSLLLSSLTIIFFNKISNDEKMLDYNFKKFSLGIFLLVLPLVLIVSVYGLDILNLIYGSKVFVNRVGVYELIVIAFINIYFMGKISLLIKSLILLNKPNILIISTLLGVIINAVVNFYFIDLFGLKGIITTTTIVNFILMSILQYNVLSRFTLFRLIPIDLLFVLFILYINL